MKITTDWKNIPFEKIVSLYESVGWQAYTYSPEKTAKALENSSLVVIGLNEKEEVMGLARSLSDGAYIHYLQDILVRPSDQRSGVGRALLQKVLKNFSEVRTHILLTDDEEKQKRFYQSLGFKKTADLEELNAFVKFKRE